MTVPWNGTIEWTDAVIARLRALWAEGHSSAEIGRRLGTTKNAVIGKARRIGCLGRPDPIKPRLPGDPRPLRIRHPKQALAIAPCATNAPLVVALPPAAAPLVLRPLLRMIRSRGCQYPLWTDGTPRKDRRFCNAAIVGPGSWCPSCRTIVFTGRHFTGNAQDRIAAQVGA